MRKKLIEVALPLEAINQESAREKSIRHGHPSTLHIWWARRPLAACRAVLFASLVDDPSSRPEEFPTDEEQEQERQRLFRIIEDLVKWENSNNHQVIEAARNEIVRSTGGKLPALLDPFCGGGSIPLEGQRLGLRVYASDLNPVAVLITKALVELPAQFANKAPVNPKARHRLGQMGQWPAASGLADDVRYYGEWMRDEAEHRLGHLYPKTPLPEAHGGGEATVLAWLWARTVKCPNPACGAQAPLVRTFWLSKGSRSRAWIEPQLDLQKHPPTITFHVKAGAGSPRDGTVGRRGAACLACNTPIPFDHIRVEGRANRFGFQLMAQVVELGRGRIYVDATLEQQHLAESVVPTWTPETSMPEQALGFRVQLYGMLNHRDLFTRRQLLTLSTVADLTEAVREKVLADAGALRRDDASDYADAVAAYVGLTASKAARFSTVLSFWRPDEGKLSRAFGRQAVPMTWDFAETNPFSASGGDLGGLVQGTADVLLRVPANPEGIVNQAEASTIQVPATGLLVSTDPPYYDNVPYADLSDIFYVWLRRSLSSVFPTLFATLLVPKNEELVADPFRFGGKERAEAHFLDGMKRTFRQIQTAVGDEYPATIYYAFKQAETDEESPEERRERGVASTGWETMLEGLLQAGFRVTGTWPMRTEGPTRMRGIGSNALASSILLVCRPRGAGAAMATRREFIGALKRELPDALRKLQHGNIAPVDLAQAAIGPGMAVFSCYSRVLEQDGSPMTVRAALALINQTLDEVLAEQEGEFDADTRWAVAWFEQNAMNEGQFGQADVLARAKNTSVQGLANAGVLEARSGKVRLLRREELPPNWDPAADQRITVWEVSQHLIRALLIDGSEERAAGILRQVGGLGEVSRDLAYRLYGICERKGWAQEALAYNSLVVAWPVLRDLAQALPSAQPQTAMNLEE